MQDMFAVINFFHRLERVSWIKYWLFFTKCHEMKLHLCAVWDDQLIKFLRSVGC